MDYPYIPKIKNRLRQIALIWLSGLLLLAGCANLQSLGEPPVRIGIRKLELAPPPLVMFKSTLLNDRLADYLKKPVLFDAMTPRQMRIHLGTGRLKFAMLSPADFAQIVHSENYKILGVPKNNNGQTYRRGLLIVSAKSKINSLEELKNKRFHFMPHGSILNELALGALLESNVAKVDLDKGILGLELDTHHISSLEVAKSVVIENNVAGVIDEADYEKWPEKGGSLILLLPSKDQVRVIGKTIRVPEGPFVVSTNTPNEMTEKVKQCLFPESKNAGNLLKLALSPMGYTGFAEPIEPAEYELYFSIHKKLQPPEPQEPNPDSQPS